MAFKSIVGRLSFYLSVIILLITILFSALSYSIQSKTIHDNLETELTRWLNTSAQSLNLPLWRMDYPAIEGVIESVGSDPEIVSIKLYDANDNKIYDASRTGELYSIGTLYKGTTEITYNDQVIGSVELTLTDYFEVQGFISMIGKMIGLIFIQIIIILFVIKYWMEIELWPLKEIDQIAQRIAEGKFDNPISHMGHNEIGTLSDTICYMQGKLSDQKVQITENVNEIQALYSQMKAYSEQLEDSVEMT